MASSGPVLGLQDCPVVLPNVLTEFRQTCQQLASAAQQSLGLSGTTDSSSSQPNSSQLPAKSVSQRESSN